MEFKNSALLKCVGDKTAVSATGNGLLLCAECNAVLGESCGVCGELKSMESIMCLRTTNDVVISDEVELGHKGEMAECIYSSLKCRGCDSALGIVIHSAPSRLAAVRSLFLLHKANITCYILGSPSVVKASLLSFDVKPLGPYMNKMRKQFTAQLEQITQIKKRLDNRNVNSSSDK